MSWNEVRAMAVKKGSKAKKSSTPKTKPKSAIKKAAPKKAVKKASVAKVKPKVKAAAAKKVVKKASPVKLTDSQQKLLFTVSQTPSPGYLGNKAEAKALASLLQKRVVKTGKKEGGFFRYMVTKLGEKYIPKAAPPAPSVESAPAAPAPASAPAAPASAPPTS
jgi:hypothetical protein